MIAKKAIREVQEYALEKEGDELKNLVKPFVPSHMKNSSLKELLLPKESEDDDSDYDSLLQDDNDQDMINSSSSSSSNVVNTSTPPRSRELYETAESITVDDLLDDINYIDENNMKDLKELYERIKNRMRKDH